MAGMDKYLLEEKLLALGWREATEEERQAVEEIYGKSPYLLVPPDTLWEKRPKALHVYDARDLQNLLGESVKEEE